MPLPSDFGDLEVGEVMHSGVIDCPPQTPIRDLAPIMAENKVHCVVVNGLARDAHNADQLVWGVITAFELMRAIATNQVDQEVGRLAASEVVTIGPHEPLHHAAQVMSEHECSHLIVVDPGTGRPTGVVSSIDIACGLAWGPRPLSVDPVT